MRVGSEQRHAGLLAEALRSTARAVGLDAGRAVSALAVVTPPLTSAAADTNSVLRNGLSALLIWVAKL